MGLSQNSVQKGAPWNKYFYNIIYKDFNSIRPLGLSYNYKSAPVNAV